MVTTLEMWIAFQGQNEFPKTTQQVKHSNNNNNNTSSKQHTQQIQTTTTPPQHTQMATNKVGCKGRVSPSLPAM
jgi:hypothetical protein